MDDSVSEYRSTGLPLVFFFSGAAALLFETIWFYQCGLALGNSYWAAAAVLSSFMSGLALGNFLSLRSTLARRYPIQAYAILELCIAVLGPAVVYLLPAIGKGLSPWLGGLAGQPAILNPMRFLIAFACLLAPAAAMGFTLPLLTEALTREGHVFRESLGKLYGWNTFGAVLGTLAGEIFLIKWFGIRGTALFAAALNIGASIVAFQIAATHPTPEPSPVEPGEAPSTASGLVLEALAIGLSGTLLLALEVIWLRALALFIEASSLAFALVLSVVLAGIALGGMAAGRGWIKFRNQAIPVWAVPFLTGCMCTVSYLAFPIFLSVHHGHFVSGPGRILLMAAGLILPTSFFSGAFFTLAGEGLRSRFKSSQGATGGLTLFNTLGAALGAPLASFLMIPSLGIERSLFIVTLAYGLVGALWAFSSRVPPKRMLGVLGIWLLALALFPSGQMAGRFVPMAMAQWIPGPNARILNIHEGVNETITHLESRQFGSRQTLRMITNSFSMSGNNLPGRRYMKTFVYWPMAFHPEAEQALLICFGVGNTAKALTDFKSLKSIDVVDISKDVLGLSTLAFPDPAQNPLHDPRVRTHVEDGRFFLQSTPRKFDLITGEPPPPTVPGVAVLYSREYFQLLHDRLNPGGIATYWLPIMQMGETPAKAIIRGFTDVFGESYLWHGADSELILIGVRAGGSPRPDAFPRLWQDPRQRPELQALGLETPTQLLSGFIGDREYLRRITQDTPPLLDNYPKRILTKWQPDAPLFRSWYDTEACKARFQASQSLQARLSPTLCSAALPAFDFQTMLVSMGHSAQDGPFPRFDEIHRTLTKSALKAPALWALGSNDDTLRIVDALPEDSKHTPEAQFHLGCRSLADRNLQGAFDHMKVAIDDPVHGLVAKATCIYALCLSGHTKEAAVFLDKHPTSPGKPRLPDWYFKWLKSEFQFLPAS